MANGVTSGDPIGGLVSQGNDGGMVMAKKRVVVRCRHSSELSGSEQKDFADDVKGRLEGTGINGYFITSRGSDWIEWEGDATTVDSKVNEHLNDSRISGYDVVEETEIASLNADKWRAHTEPDLHSDIS